MPTLAERFKGRRWQLQLMGWRARQVLAGIGHRPAPLDVVVIQSADPMAGAGLLAQSSRTSAEYCRRHGFEFRPFLGIRRGVHPWHATFNRVFQLRELSEQGFRGWVFHLDADAIIVSLNFDLRWLMPKRDVGLIACPSGATDQPWDINSGVFLLNLGSAEGRRIVDRWYESVMAIPDDALRHAPSWGDLTGDQARLHTILMRDPELLRALHIAPSEILNHYSREMEKGVVHPLPFGTRGHVFVRHFFRASGGTMDQRAAMLKTVADDVLGRDDRLAIIRPNEREQ